MKNRLKITLLGSIIILLNVSVFSQQTAQYTLNSFNKYVVNPAVVGTENFIDFKASHRTQWTGLESAPQTSYFSFHTPLGKDLGSSHHHKKNEKTSWFGVGTLLEYDVTGPFKRLKAYGSGSYNIKLNNTLRISFGLSLGIQNLSFDGTEVILADQNDALFDQSTQQLNPDAQAGLWLYSNQFYFGFSSQQLLNNRLNFSNPESQDAGSSNLNRHYSFATGVNLPASSKISIYPSLLVRVIPPAPVTIDLGLRATLDQKYWAGLFVRSDDSFSLALGGLFYKSYSVTYSYDISLSSLSPFNNGSHELLVGFRFPPQKHLDCPSKFWN